MRKEAISNMWSRVKWRHRAHCMKCDEKCLFTLYMKHGWLWRRLNDTGIDKCYAASSSIRPLLLCLGYSWFQGENISRFTLWRWSKLRLHISFCLFWEKQPPCKPGECCRIASALDVDIKSSPQWMSGSWCAKAGEWLHSRVTSGRSALLHCSFPWCCLVT